MIKNQMPKMISCTSEGGLSMAFFAKTVSAQTNHDIFFQEPRSNYVRHRTGALQPISPKGTKKDKRGECFVEPFLKSSRAKKTPPPPPHHHFRHLSCVDCFCFHFSSIITSSRKIEASHALWCTVSAVEWVPVSGCRDVSSTDNNHVYTPPPPNLLKLQTLC